MALVEHTAHRRGASEVGGIVVLCLGTSITYHHTAFLQHVVMTMVVQGLAIDAQDDGERHRATARKRQAFHHTSDFLLDHTRLTHLHGGGMHIVGRVGCTFHLGDFKLALHLTHGDDSLDEFQTDILLHLVDMAVQPIRTLDLCVATVGRQHVYLAAFDQGLLEVFSEMVEVAAVGDADAVALLFQRRQGATPNHVVDGDIHAKENLLATLKVDDADQVGVVETEIIGEVAVLTIDVGVVGIVEGGFVVGREESDALRDHFFQCSATATVNIFCKHICLILLLILCLLRRMSSLRWLCGDMGSMRLLWILQK